MKCIGCQKECEKQLCPECEDYLNEQESSLEPNRNPILDVEKRVKEDEQFLED